MKTTILPESMFEEYSDLKEHKWNGVLLNAKEHFICHLCIWKHYKSLKYTNGEIKMSRAMNALNGMGIYKSKHYEHLKLNLSHSDETKEKMKSNHSDFTGEKHPMYGKKHSKVYAEIPF